MTKICDRCFDKFERNRPEMPEIRNATLELVNLESSKRRDLCDDCILKYWMTAFAISEWKPLSMQM